jgi:hypothetical protein
VSVLTPAGPGAEPGRAKHLVQARLERCVRLEVVRPRWHGLEGAAHCIRGGTRVRGNEGVDLALLFVFIQPISVFLRNVGRSRAEQCQRRRMTWMTYRGRLGVHAPGLAHGARVHGGQHGTSDLHRAGLRRGADPYLRGVHRGEELQTVMVKGP